MRNCSNTPLRLPMANSLMVNSSFERREKKTIVKVHVRHLVRAFDQRVYERLVRATRSQCLVPSVIYCLSSF